MKIEWVRTSKSEFNALLKEQNWKPNSCGAFHSSPDGINHTIYIMYHASTKFRLHELGHCVNGHKDAMGKLTYGEIAKRELEAEAFMYSKMGKPCDAFLFRMPIWILTSEAKCRPCHTFSWIMDNTDGYITITPKIRSAIWEYIISYYKIFRESVKNGGYR